MFQNATVLVGIMICVGTLCFYRKIFDGVNLNMIYLIIVLKILWSRHNSFANWANDPSTTYLLSGFIQKQLSSTCLLNKYIGLIQGMTQLNLFQKNKT